MIPAEIAYECLQSVPNYQEPALRLLLSLRTYIEFLSTKEILKDPPSGYLFPPVDIDYALAAIEEKVLAGEYQSEYDFQTELQSLIISVRDGHFYWLGDILGAFTFARLNAELVAISSDGVETPEIYFARKCPLLFEGSRRIDRCQSIFLEWTIPRGVSLLSRDSRHPQ